MAGPMSPSLVPTNLLDLLHLDLLHHLAPGVVGLHLLPRIDHQLGRGVRRSRGAPHLDGVLALVHHRRAYDVQRDVPELELGVDAGACEWLYCFIMQ